MERGPWMKAWLPVLLWAAVISSLSTDTFSAEHTSRIIVPVLHWLFPHASMASIETVHFLIRKSAHFTEYFILSLLLMRALRGHGEGWNLRLAIWAIAISAVYAGLDEFHQSFVPSRTASPWDSLLDTVGASCAQIAWWIVAKLRRSNVAVTGD
jgi:VanZ family protein